MFIARSLRLLSYGYLSIILAVYLTGLGLSVAEIGTLFTVALARRRRELKSVQSA